MKKNALFIYLVLFSMSTFGYNVENSSPARILSSKLEDPWVLPTGTQFTMPIAAIVKKNGVLSQPDGQYLGIFKNNICQGYTILTEGPVGLIYVLTAMYSTNNVPGFTFKVYDSYANQYYDVVETVTFVKNTSIGNADVPKVLNLKFAITKTTGNALMGSVSGTANGSFTSNQSVSVTATPTSGYHFVNWTDGVGGTEMSTDAIYTFSASENRNLIANFDKTTNINQVPDFKIGVFPNPIINFFELSFNSPTYTYSTVEIYDLRGLLVKQVFSGSFVGDKVIVVERGNSFSFGLYILKVKNGTSQSVRKILFQ